MTQRLSFNQALKVALKNGAWPADAIGEESQQLARHLQAWDEQGCVPTTYAKTTAALEDVRIERLADRVERDGKTIAIHTRPAAMETQEEPYESE